MKLMNENLFEMCVRMFEERARAHDKAQQIEMACVYANCAQMLKYAIEGNYDCLRQWDYYGED